MYGMQLCLTCPYTLKYNSNIKLHGLNSYPKCVCHIKTNIGIITYAKSSQNISVSSTQESHKDKPLTVFQNTVMLHDSVCVPMDDYH